MLQSHLLHKLELELKLQIEFHEFFDDDVLSWLVVHSLALLGGFLYDFVDHYVSSGAGEAADVSPLLPLANDPDSFGHLLTALLASCEVLDSLLTVIYNDGYISPKSI